MLVDHGCWKMQMYLYQLSHSQNNYFFQLNFKDLSMNEVILAGR